MIKARGMESKRGAKPLESATQSTVHEGIVAASRDRKRRVNPPLSIIVMIVLHYFSHYGSILRGLLLYSQGTETQSKAFRIGSLARTTILPDLIRSPQPPGKLFLAKRLGSLNLAISSCPANEEFSL
jgi:hypothetical protein